MDVKLLELYPDKMTTMERYLILKLQESTDANHQLKERIASGSIVDGEHLNRLLQMEEIVNRMVKEPQTENTMYRNMMGLSKLVK